jgi:hypothetical protein
MSTTPAETSTDIDPLFRPRTYFWPLDLILSSIKGADRRAYVKAMFDQGREHELPDYVFQSSLTEETRRAAGAIHPSLMGGEYLPDRTQREVEIARITIASTMQDVTCVYARRGKSRIHYRIIDEFEGETLTGKRKRTSKRPLTLAELADFFLGGWDLLQVLEMNSFGEPGRADEARAFAWASSEFYPGFKQLIQQRVEAWVQEQAKGATA